MFKGQSLMPLITQLKTIFHEEIVDFAMMNSAGFYYAHGEYLYSQAAVLAKTNETLKKDKKRYQSINGSEYFTLVFFNQIDTFLCIAFFNSLEDSELHKAAYAQLKEVSFFDEIFNTSLTEPARTHDYGVIGFDDQEKITLMNRFAEKIFGAKIAHLKEMKPHIEAFDAFYRFIEDAKSHHTLNTTTITTKNHQSYHVSLIISPTNKHMQMILTHSPVDALYGNILESFDHLKLGFAHCILEQDAEGKYSDARIMYGNEAYGSMMGIDLQYTIGKTIHEVYPDFSSSRFKRYARVATSGKSYAFDDYVSAYDKYFHIYCYAPRKNEFINVYYETTAYHKLMETRQLQLQKIQMTMTLAEMGFFELNMEKKQLQGDTSVQKILGIDNLNYETYRKLFYTRLHEEDRSIVYEKNALLMNGTITEGNAIFRLYSKNRKKVHYIELYLSCTEYDATGRAKKLIGLVRDITERKEIEAQIAYYADHDPLSNLYNRRHLEKTLKDNTFNYPIKVAILDLDGLKTVNDLFGHERGDYVICKFSELLKDIYKDAYIARYGGDEFIILFSQLKHPTEHYERILQENLNDMLEGNIPLGVSIGYETLNKNDDFNGKLRIAEESMYRKKLLERTKRKKRTLEVLERYLHRHEPELTERIERLHHLTQGLMRYHGFIRHDEHRIMELVVRHHAIGRVMAYIHKLKPNSTLKLYQYLNVEASFKILSNLLEEEVVRRSILHQSEYFNGTGYPHQLKGKEIPVYSRILALCLRYDILTSPYEDKPKVSPAEALKKLEQYSSRRYDPDLLKSFIKMITEEEIH